MAADGKDSVRRGAILGAGNVAIRGHLPGWLEREDVAIVAAADPRRAAREALAERLPNLRLYETADELLSREELDFADVCAPPAMHAGLIAAALEKGLHVLCEKPLVLTEEELTPLREIALRRDRALAAVHNWRHAPILAAAQTLLAAGEIGEVRFCRWETQREEPAAAGDTGKINWRVDPAVSGGGILMDHGWHALYVVCGWLPASPKRVSGRLSTRRHTEWPIEDTAEVILECGGGERAEILLTWAADERRNRATVVGSGGAIRLNGSYLELFRNDSPEPAMRRDFADSLSEGSHHPGWFARVAEEFLSEIRDPARRGRSLAEASDCLEIIGIARESSLRGGAALPVGREAGRDRAPAGRAAP